MSHGLKATVCPCGRALPTRIADMRVAVNSLARGLTISPFSLDFERPAAASNLVTRSARRSAVHTTERSIYLSCSGGMCSVFVRAFLPCDVAPRCSLADDAGIESSFFPRVQQLHYGAQCRRPSIPQYRPHERPRLPAQT